MSFDTFVAVLVFSIVMGFTPGPNNVMLASSGATYGVRRTWPHLMGVALGFPAMILVIGLGLASLLLASTGLQLGMKVVSSLYLLWLAFQIARSSSVSGAAASARPLTFLQAAAFQWINPKAWLIAVGAIVATKAVLIDKVIAPSYRFTAFVGWDQVLLILPVVFLTGILIAAIAAALTLRRYLRV